MLRALWFELEPEKHSADKFLYIDSMAWYELENFLLCIRGLIGSEIFAMAWKPRSMVEK